MAKLDTVFQLVPTW